MEGIQKPGQALGPGWDPTPAVARRFRCVRGGERGGGPSTARDIAEGGAWTLTWKRTPLTLT